MVHLSIACLLSVVCLAGLVSRSFERGARPFNREAGVSVILSHDHPSGDPEPSIDDIKITRMGLCESFDIVDINVLDHIIIGNGGYFSIKLKQII